MGKQAKRLVTAHRLRFVDSELDHLTVVIESIARQGDAVFSADYWQERVLDVIADPNAPQQRHLKRAAYLLAKLEATTLMRRV
jgi:hypothetical protein